jgi:hypothetical protein
MSTARHRDDVPWWERDDRTWPDVVEWFVCRVFVPAMVGVVVVLAVLAVIRDRA